VLSSVLRRRGERTNCEERQLEVVGATLVVHRWTYAGGFSRSRASSSTVRCSDRPAARRALRAMVRDLVRNGWGELPAWPELPPDWGPAATTAPARRVRSPRPAKRPRAPRPPRVTLRRLRLDGRAWPVSRRRLDALEHALGTTTPGDWRALLERFGAGTFAGRLRFEPPERVLQETRRFRRQYADEYRTFFANHDEALGERARSLVLLASSIEGDRLGFLSEEPGRLLLLPRNGQTIFVGDLAEVLGRYAQLARDLDGAPPTFASRR
jgi:hypothetical protein